MIRQVLLASAFALTAAPVMAQTAGEAQRDINQQQKVTVFLVEQNAFHALRLAHRGYVMINGRIALTGTGAELLKNAEVRAAYLEGGH